MLGDAKKYEQQLGEQAAKQREHHAAEIAGQQRLPINMPQTSQVDPVEAARAELGMTEDEKRLASELLVFSIMLMLTSSRNESKEANDRLMCALLNKHERELIMKHRAIVAKVVSASKLPAAGSF